MPPLSIMIKPVSDVCNMSCDYCFYHDEAKKRNCSSYGIMTEQTIKNIIRKTLPSATGFISYAFQGGEPTLRGLDFYEKVMEYQKKYNNNNIPVFNALQSNGYELDDKWCRFFKQNGFLIGISVDGTAATHNLYRHGWNGTDTYENVVRTTKLLDRYKIDYNILTVVHSGVAKHVSDIYARYKQNNWKYQQYIACMNPYGEQNIHYEFTLDPEEYGTFLIHLFDLWYYDWKKGRQPYIRQFENYIGILMGVPPEACEQRGNCGIQYVVEADGSVYPCDFYALDEYRLGNFNQDRLEQIDAKRTEIGFINKSKKHSETCTTCEYYILCRGGCQRNRIWQNGRLTNRLCEGYKRFFEECSGRMLQIKDQILKK